MLVKALGTASSAGPSERSLSLLIDESTLLDCGAGIQDLPPSKLMQIDKVLLSHSHLDRCGSLPLLAQAHASHHGSGFTVYALQQTLDTLSQHMFNGTAVPDYTTMATENGAVLVHFQAVEVGDALPLPGGLVTPLPAQHIIPALGWLLEGEWRSMGITGDSGPCPAFWHWISNDPSLTDVICDLRYSTAQTDTAQSTGHMSPSLLQPFLSLLPPNSQIWLNHIARGTEDTVLTEVKALLPGFLHAELLVAGSTIEL